MGLQGWSWAGPPVSWLMWPALSSHVSGVQVPYSAKPPTVGLQQTPIIKWFRIPRYENF